MNILFAFMRMLQAMSALKWPHFEAMYAFIPANHVKLTDGYDFSWKIPAAITWKEPVPQGRLNDHWAVDRVDFEHIWSTVP